MADDLKFAVRSLRNSPGFAAVAILSLALGTGANTAIFSLIDAVMLKMVPVARPEQLVFVNSNAIPSGSVKISHAIALATLQQIDSRATSIRGAGSFVVASQSSIGVNGQAEVATPQFVAGGYFETLGVAAILGRTIRREDNHAGDRVAVLTYGYWQRRFGRDPGVLGRQITVNRVPFTVIGVLPPEFYGLSLDSPAEMFLPISTTKQVDAGQVSASQPEPKENAGYLFARLNPGMAASQAQAELSVLFRQTEMALAVADPVERANLEKRWIEFTPASLGISLARYKFSQPLKILMGVVALVMLIACANIANLLLAKSTARRREVAIRLSLGSTRWRLIRQLLTESLLLSIAGGLLGVLFAVWARRGIVYLAGDPAIPVDWNLRVAAFTAGVMLLNALIFGIAPAFRATGIDFAAALRSGRTGRAAGRLSFGRALAVGQIALSLPLLIGAALFLETFRNLDRIDLGFARDHGLLATLDPALAGRTGSGIPQSFRDVLDRVNALPGVRSASLIRYRLMGDRLSLTSVHVPGYTLKAGEDPSRMWVLFHDVGPRFFATSGIPLVAGRDFSDRDDERSPRVAVISETMARHYFDGANPIGQRIFRDPKHPPIEIIGVARDVKYMNRHDEDRDAMFAPLLQDNPQWQHDPSAATLLVRTAGDPAALAPALRAVIRDVDANLPVLDVKTMEAQVSTSLAQQRLLAILSGFFGMLALGLAAIGLYGVLSYGVSQRTGEIGIRMALGAQRAGILQMILRETATMVLLGIAAGLAIAFTAARLIQSMLYHVTPTDPFSLGVAVAILGAVALIAGFLSARRASLVEPMTALRQE